MKFRTISRIIYLRRARHRRGHGIHSPFLFRLITEVVENRNRFPEYNTTKILKDKALRLMSNVSNPLVSTIYRQFNLPPGNPNRLYRKVELPSRYGKVVFRLIREFKPSAVFSYGPTLGTNLALIATANKNSTIYQFINDSAYELVSKELLENMAVPNIHFFDENVVLPVNPEFKIVNYPVNPEASRNVIQQCLQKHGDDDVLIIRGIHESNEMEVIWQELIVNRSVRVSLDLFEIGIALFRKGLQKEDFIQRF